MSDSRPKERRMKTLTGFGAKKVINYATEVLRGRRIAITFALDNQGNLIEVCNGKMIDHEIKIFRSQEFE